MKWGNSEEKVQELTVISCPQVHELSTPKTEPSASEPMRQEEKHTH